MTPKEIAYFKQQSPLLRQALQGRKADVWRFLRHDVIARYGYYPQGAHHCEQCGKITYPTLKSPYNAFHPGWCLDCVLHAYLTNAPLWVNTFKFTSPTKEQIERLIRYKREHPEYKHR